MKVTCYHQYKNFDDSDSLKFLELPMVLSGSQRAVTKFRLTITWA